MSLRSKAAAIVRSLLPQRQQPLLGDTTEHLILCALMDRKNGCGVRDGLQCPDCQVAAEVAMKVLWDRGWLKQSTTYDQVEAIWPRDIRDSDPFAVAIRRALVKHPEVSQHHNVNEATLVIVACLYRHGRLDFDVTH